jgi:sarcosine oxidase, subunit beta
VSPEVIIVGGGIQGCAAAVELALQGLRVTLVEKNYCGRHASGVNAGGVNRLGRFPSELPLSEAALELWHRIESIVDDDCGFRATGRMKVAESEAELEVLERRYREVRTLGWDHEQLLDAQELRELEPDVSPAAAGAILSPACGHANPFRTVQAYRHKAERLGVRILEGTRVGRVRRHGGRWQVQTDRGPLEAPVLINTAGAWADRIAADAGDPVPLEAIAPMLMITARMPRIIRGVIGAADRTLSIKQLANGTVIIGGGYRGRADRDAESTTLDHAKLAFNARIATELFPALETARIVRAWAGIEARTADGLPIIGPGHAEEGVFHAFGFSAHGFHLGPVIGRILAELVTTGRSNLPIEAFRIERFAA